jgi:hypothetical protein
LSRDAKPSKITKRRFWRKSVRRQNCRGVTFWVFGDGNKGHGAIDIPAPKPHRVFRGSENERIELVAESWSAPIGHDQRRHPIVHAIRDRAVDNGDVRPHALQHPYRIWIVEQGKQQMLKGDIPMRTLLGRVPGAPQSMV